jgi:hypothetical protein
VQAAAGEGGNPVDIRLHGTADECREVLELLDNVMVVQSVRGPYQDRQRSETERSILVRIYINAIPRGDRKEP